MKNIKIFRSTRRKRTVSAKCAGSSLVIYLPEGLPETEEKKWIAKMVEHFERHEKRHKIDNSSLERRANALNHRYFEDSLKINSIKFVTNQNSRFGSCNTNKGTIRISDKLADMPLWVLDYLIVHELAHLVHSNHSKDFWKLVNNYPYAERARGFLIAKGMEEDVSKSYS